METLRRELLWCKVSAFCKGLLKPIAIHLARTSSDSNLFPDNKAGRPAKFRESLGSAKGRESI